MATRTRTLDFGAAVDEQGVLFAEGSGRLVPSPEWTSEHLLLAALARCIISSLRYHTKRAGIELRARATASGTVTRREEDGRYAFVELHVAPDVTLTPAPDPSALAELLAHAERGCFIGASMAATPHYSWRVNGHLAGPPAPPPRPS